MTNEGANRNAPHLLQAQGWVRFVVGKLTIAASQYATIISLSPFVNPKR